MNKSDIKLIIVILFISIATILFINLFSSADNNEALVYYENKVVLKIDMKINKKYIVKGYNGEVEIEVKDNKIRVKNEKSPLNICSKQGYVSNSYTPIICLPNKIVVKINNKDIVDSIVN